MLILPPVDPSNRQSAAIQPAAEQSLALVSALVVIPAPNHAPDLLKYGDHDVGNAERLVALYGDFLRFCYPLKKWLIWDGTRWLVDETEECRRFAKLTMSEFLRQAIARGTYEQRDKERRDFAFGCMNAGPISNMLRMAQSEVYAQPAELDIHPYLLNFRNGTVDLRTGVLRAHQPGDFITKLVQYNYTPGARCPRFLAFLKQIMPNRRMVQYLQRALGYSLTGCTIEKAVFILFGEGNNGKTTLLALIRKLITEYAALLQVDTLMVRQESNNSQSDLADLRGARFVQTSESESGQRLAQGKLKRITQGMGSIKAVRKYENPIEFPETHKLWIDTNRRPTITDADDQATFNRLHPIPFDVSIPKDEIDRDLPAKLLLEAEGILAWMVAGAKLWHQHGLEKPPAVEAANEQWRTESDQLELFIADRCKQSGEIPAAELYEAYRNWAEKGAQKGVLTQKDFGVKMSARPGVSKRRTKHGMVYVGLSTIGRRASLLPKKRPGVGV